MIEVMKKAFCLENKLTARDWRNGLIIFSFGSVIDRDWMVSNQPQHFNDNLFAIKPFNGSKQPSSIRITSASFWARAHDLPIDFHNEEIILVIAGKVGNLKCYEKPLMEDPIEFICFKVD